MTATYAARAQAYAQRVVAGEEIAGKYERLACKRYLHDLERQGTVDFPYVIDERLGSRECQFLELLPHIKGEWAKPIYTDGKLSYAKIVLEDWQVFIEFQLFGWVHQATRLRRFRRSYEEIARKNAKSTRAAGRKLYMAFADNEPGAHVYSAATTADQAREVFDVAREMALRDPEFRQRFGVTVGRYDITSSQSASSLKILNAEASTQDGLNVHGAVVDEVHAHKKRDLWDVIESADGARAQPLISAITTAGRDLSGICYELRGYTVKVLEGTHADETWFGIIFTIDEGDDWTDPAIWRKANPNLGISAKLDKLEAACRKAQALVSARGNFLTKHLNVWTNAGSAWMDMEAWGRCADRDMRESEFDGEEGWDGLDLAQKNDFAAKVKVFERDGFWHVFTRLYYNETALQESPNAQLQGWVDQGHVEVNPGNLTDFDVIATDLRADCKRHDMQEIAFDPALSMYFAGKLVEEGLPMVEITQRSMFFTQVLLQVENLVLAGKLKHDGNPVMTWMVGNLIVKKSKFNELMAPTKDREENKIDGAMAMLMALGRALAVRGAESIYNDREVMVLD
jgi:phage terminase large subunit-like protein